MALKRLLLPVALLFSMLIVPTLFVTAEAASDVPTTIVSHEKQTQYEETDSVIFADQTVYFKFNDPDVITTIVQKRWSAGILYSQTEQQALYDYTYNTASRINAALENVLGHSS
jgi:hypothetical protein